MARSLVNQCGDDHGELLKNPTNTCCRTVISSVESEGDCTCRMVIEPFYILSPLAASNDTIAKLYAICNGGGHLPNCNHGAPTSEPSVPPQDDYTLVVDEPQTRPIDPAPHNTKKITMLKISNGLGWSVAVLLAVLFVWDKRALFLAKLKKNAPPVLGEVQIPTVYTTALEDPSNNSAEDRESTNQPSSSSSSITSPETAISEPEAPLMALTVVKESKAGTLLFLSRIRGAWKH